MLNRLYIDIEVVILLNYWLINFAKPKVWDVCFKTNRGLVHMLKFNVASNCQVYEELTHNKLLSLPPFLT